MTERHKERELVLAPNEFAWVLDTTKGHINCYVGPNKTSLAQTDQPVAFNRTTKRFENVELSVATQLNATAPSNWYIVLKNPAANGQRPSAGVSNAMAELDIGRKVVLQGPQSFPLWPGQMVQVIEGHVLESNQYLEVRIYDAERAQEGMASVLDDEAGALEVGQSLVIRGTDASFFIPPDGAEVVPDRSGNYVRDAVTLNALEYCVLEADDGTRKYVRGEAVVFPQPGESFHERRGRRKFAALELSGTTGIHVKVVAPYTDEDGSHEVGEELFVTGENRIYFPRPEHVLVRYPDGAEVHHAVAIPRGEGRYVLDRSTGEVQSVVGPRMFLPDPRREVIVRRVLTDRECNLLYPGNDEVRRHNGRLRTGKPVDVAPEERVDPPKQHKLTEVIERDWTPPRTLTLDDRLNGVVSVDVWPGYAVQVVNRADERRVEVGPKTLLLDYDETLAALSLSTGTPKHADDRLQTAFLQVRGNNVSDAFGITSADMVECWVTLTYRVEFTGDDPGKWFEVDDYVKLVCDHGRSLIGNASRGRNVRDLFLDIADVVRDTVLGTPQKNGSRAGRVFAENGMRIHDIEVLEFSVLDDDVADILLEAQRDAIARAVSVTTVSGHHETERLRLQLEAEHNELEFEVKRRERQARSALEEMQRAAELKAAQDLTAVIEQTMAGRKMEHEAELAQQTNLLELRTKELQARVDAATKHAQAYSPHLVEAIQRLGDEELLGKLSDNFSELAAVEGRGLLETARKFLDFVPAGYLPHLNGNADAAE